MRKAKNLHDMITEQENNALEEDNTLDLRNINSLKSDLEDKWENTIDFRTRMLQIGGSSVLIAWLSSLVDTVQLHEAIVKPLLVRTDSPVNTIAQVSESISASNFRMVQIDGDYHRGIESGHVVLFLNGSDMMLDIDISNFPTKSIEVSEIEPSIQGPQEAFTQKILSNLGLLRKLVRNPRLKVEFVSLGEVTHTPVALLYIDGILNPSYLNEARSRLAKIKIDGVLHINVIEELTKKDPYSPFPTMEISERPDKVASGLMQGRLGIMVEGTSSVGLAPAVFINFLSSSEDYYGNYMITFMVRILRHVMFWTTIFLPGFYISSLSFNQDLLPTSLLINLESQYEGIPFPTFIEAFVMLFFFEAIREAGIRLPRAVGQSVSIVGALVIGDAAVNAGLVSPGMVIVVSATGVASFTLPVYELVSTVRLLQPVVLISASLLGLYGVALVGIATILHMVMLSSWGTPYMAPLAPVISEDVKDSVVRSPWWKMTKRPSMFHSVNRTMQRVNRDKNK